jgi:ribosomal-protein-alanine N-acetyltransferase
MPQLVGPVVAAGTLRRTSQPLLHVDELQLRPWRPDDAPGVVLAYDDPAIRRWHLRSVSVEEVRSWLDRWARRWSEETGASWAVTRDAVDLLGQVSLRTLSLAEGQAEVSYWVLPAARGRAVAPRALDALTTWATHDLGLHRLELAHSTANAASCRVALKAGYVLEGTKRREALHADGWHDMHLHARLATDEPEWTSGRTAI